jgi:norsolorinic acid ketoreductase
VRDPESSSAKDLAQVEVGSQTKLIIVKLDLAVDSDAAAAVKELETKHGIQSLDVVIANGGIGQDYHGVLETELSQVRDHFNINTVGKY